MGTNNLIALACILVITEVSQAQYYGRMRNMIPRDHYGCTCEDLVSLLARACEEKPEPAPHVPCASYPNNFEEVIMKLVNALVYTTTTQAQNTCHCSNTGGSNSSGGSHNSGGSNNSGHSNSGGGLLDIDLLNGDKNDNVLDIDLGRQQLLGLGLGGRGYDRGSPAHGGQHTSRPNSGEGLINLDLLNGGKGNNVADLSIGNQDVLGVGLGGNRGAANNNPNGSGHSTGDGLIRIDILDQK